MISSSVAAALSIACYLLVMISHGLRLRRNPQSSPRLLQAGVAVALVFHLIAAVEHLFQGHWHLSIAKTLELIFAMMNLIVLLSSLKKPVHNLFLVLIPLSVLTLLFAFGDNPMPTEPRPSDLFIAHVVFSVLAYSTLTIAAVQAVLLAYQDHQLRHHHLRGNILRALPPLQTMESLLFEMVGAGFVVLTFSLATGFFAFDDLLEQQLAHKTFFSILAWIFFAILLGGRHFKGWRGNTAIRWTWAGFLCIGLGYLGSKFVIDVLLA